MPHVLFWTVATKPSGYWNSLVELCRRRGHSLEALAWGEEWKGMWMKNEALFQRLEKHMIHSDPNQLIAFIDAYDVLVVSDAEEIARTFFRIESELNLGLRGLILFGGEAEKGRFADRLFEGAFALSSKEDLGEENCSPNISINIAQKTDGERWSIVTSSASSELNVVSKAVPRQSTARIKHLNSGQYIGRAKDLWNAMNHIRCRFRGMGMNDQAAWTRYYLEWQRDENLPVVDIDWNEELFTVWTPFDSPDKLTVISGRVYNAISGTWPSIIHGPGLRDLGPLLKSLSDDGAGALGYRQEEYGSKIRYYIYQMPVGAKMAWNGFWMEIVVFFLTLALMLTFFLFLRKK
jgi:hypothetical protein